MDKNQLKQIFLRKGSDKLIKNQMNIKDILQEMLSRDPENGNKRNILFWYDAEKEFEHDIADLEFENTHVVVLNSNNAFRVKYEIEVKNLKSHYLIYAPFEKPLDRENWLLDIQKYSEEFTTDRSIYEMRSLGITDDTLRPIVKKNIKFFENEKRVNKLKSFGIEEYNSKSLEIAIISVLAKLKAPDLDELVRILLSEFINEEEKLVKEISKYGDLDSFYDLIKKRFGYTNEEFNIDEFAAMLFYTAFSYEYIGGLPKELDSLKSSRMSEIVVFLDEFMSLGNHHSAISKLSNKYEEVLKIKGLLDPVETDKFLICDTFKVIDTMIMDRVVKAIQDGNKEYETYIRQLKERRSKHWYSNYVNEYNSLIQGLELLKLYDVISNKMALETAEDYFESYISEYSRIDHYYRKFYYHYDQIENKELLLEFNQLIENTYVSGYLDNLSINWSKVVSREGFINIDGVKHKKQWNFYKDFVKEYVKKDERIFVIISDAMRYEVASELTTELMKERRAEIKLSAMQGTVPSDTKFGMATLLPYSEMTYDPASGIVIDGINTLSTKNREKILALVNADSLAIRYDDIKHMIGADYKATFTGKKLVYIYHDTVDTIGHSGSPFDAAEKAIDELKGLIKSLVNHLGATKIVVTADHGFVYQRSKLVEYDKITKIKNDAVVESDRRYILSKDSSDDMNLMDLPFNEVMKTDEDLKVIVPKGSIRFKTQGDDGNFVHGGATLQEITVPVIEYFDKRSNVFKAKKVEVQLTSITRKLTNRISNLEFFQTESISKKNLPVNLKLYFTDSDGNRVSNEVMVIADRNSETPADRSFREKFVLKDLKYQKENTYYLVFEDDDEKINPIIIKVPFYIDLAIVNDFGF